MWAVRVNHNKKPYDSFALAMANIRKELRSQHVSLEQIKPSGIRVTNFLSVSDSGDVVDTYTGKPINSEADLSG